MVDPEDAKAHFRMGVSLFALQRFMDAEAAYFSSIRVRLSTLWHIRNQLVSETMRKDVPLDQRQAT